ncbi:hypothetical protein TRM7557_03920 [Tritonibacter multivorans]|uniref:Uncharacterized protein n=1 Tax=Tritonibacter multivorans TaxID=928856 RepID=A0A0P1GJU8_9RHOB|nr:hypothetical protein TRM7557_03920 [Tritonibacter multivorans]SFC99955.1 hypothetical protein SAMN04488049_105266 [Tritonibacter multivorans]
MVVAVSATLLGILVAVPLFRDTRPGAPFNQACAIAGTICLLMPAVFFFAKRGGAAKNPPLWFVLHAICGFMGIFLISIHVASVSALSPALVPLVALMFLVCQGFWVRAFLTRRLSFLFARSPKSFDFGTALPDNRAAIGAVIEQKTALLAMLDPQANEATFSPRLRHWLRAPLKALRYDLLARREAALVGARARAGFVLSYARQLHIAVAAIFYLSLLAHVVVMLFFAGYAAKGGEVYWWHIANWGSK